MQEKKVNYIIFWWTLFSKSYEAFCSVSLLPTTYIFLYVNSVLCDYWLLYKTTFTTTNSGSKCLFLETLYNIQCICQRHLALEKKNYFHRSQSTLAPCIFITFSSKIYRFLYLQPEESTLIATCEWRRNVHIIVYLYTDIYICLCIFVFVSLNQLVTDGGVIDYLFVKIYFWSYLHL